MSTKPVRRLHGEGDDRASALDALRRKIERSRGRDAFGSALLHAVIAGSEATTAARGLRLRAPKVGTAEGKIPRHEMLRIYREAAIRQELGVKKFNYSLEDNLLSINVDNVHMVIYGEGNKEEFYNVAMNQSNIVNILAKYCGATRAEARAAIKELTARAAAPKTPRLKWEDEQREGEDPAHFVARAYAAEMAAGTLHRGVIAQEDPDLHVKLASWLRTHSMPEGVDIPTKPEWNTRQLAKRDRPVRVGRVRTEEGRLYEAQRYRRTRKTKATEPGV